MTKEVWQSRVYIARYINKLIMTQDEGENKIMIMILIMVSTALKPKSERWNIKTLPPPPLLENTTKQTHPPCRVIAVCFETPWPLGNLRHWQNVKTMNGTRYLRWESVCTESWEAMAGRVNYTHSKTPASSSWHFHRFRLEPQAQLPVSISICSPIFLLSISFAEFSVCRNTVYSVKLFISLI